jgi:Skp family chaperone for outer membrane proteins
MRTFRLIAISAVFAAVFAVSAFAQTAAGKIGLINTQAFDDEKVGITKYVAALNSLDTEFKPVYAELQAMATKLQALQKELADLQAKAQDPNNKIPIDPKMVATKAEEYEKLGREFKFKQEDAKARYERREVAVMGPIRQDIGNAIQEYTKKNGFVIMLDVAKLDNSGLLLGLDETADQTKQFITFYNARPATTAVVVPK